MQPRGRSRRSEGTAQGSPSYERENRLTTTTPDTDATALEDRLAILELIRRLALTIDGRDWDTLGQVHHRITNQVISLDGDQATCEANMQGIHVLANASGGPMWTVGGRHDYQLTRTPGGWRIAGLTFTLQWASGNMNVLTLAMAGGQS